MPTVCVNGCDLYYEAAGDGIPVVYVHGGFAALDTTQRDLKPFDWTWEHDLVISFMQQVATDYAFQRT